MGHSDDFGEVVQRKFRVEMGPIDRYRKREREIHKEIQRERDRECGCIIMI